MSVLVKGMEMPKTCDECEFHCYHSYGEYVCVATPLLYPFNLANSKGIRKDWCPLVEVPTPHGRLIDYDWVVENVIKKLGIKDKQYLLQAEKALMILVDDAPTVIEAEDGDTE